MKIFKGLILIALTIALINFTVGNFNSPGGVLGALKDNFHKYKIRFELKSADSLQALKKLLAESQKIDSVGNKLDTQIELLKHAKDLGSKKQIADSENKNIQASSSKVDTVTESENLKEIKTSSTQDEIKDFEKEILLKIRQELNGFISDKKAQNKDETLRFIYEKLKENGLLEVFERQNSQSGRLADNLSELFYLNQILDLIKSGKFEKAKELGRKVRDKELLDALSWLSKQNLYEQETWLSKVGRKIDEIKSLIQDARFIKAKAKISELKEFLKNINF